MGAGLMDTAHNPETGEFAIRFPGEGWRTVSEAEYGQARSSRIGNFAGAIADIAQDTAGFALDVAQPSFLGGSRFDVQTGETRAGPGRQMMQANDERQAARWAADPGVALGGEIASVAIPGLPLVGPATKGGRLANRFKGTADEVIATNRARMSQADQGRTLSGAPGGASGAQDLAAGSNMRDKLINTVFRSSDPDAEAIKLADDVGFRLSPAQKRGNVAMRKTEEGFIRNPGAEEVYNREIVDPNTATYTSALREGLGLEPGPKIPIDDLAKAEDAIYAEFDNITEGIVGKKRIAEHEVEQMKRLAASDDGDAGAEVYRRFVRETENQVNPKLDSDAPDLWHQPGWTSYDAETLWNRIRALNTAAAEAKGNARAPIERLRDLHEDWLAELAGESSKDVQQRMKNVNEKYRVLKTAQSTGVLKEDQPNMAVLTNAIARNFKANIGRNDYTDGRGRALEPATTRLIKAAQVSRKYPQMLNNSGTPTGQLLAGNPTGIAAKLVSSRAAAEMYFGNPLGSVGAAANTKAGAVGLGAAGLGLFGASGE